ncbi:cupin domain-containing protein [Novosphingobium taihuense]|uniref:Putative cupin superfamily protein n=1 Tax=Novosphingobium taihuense TaxID=260085 RepID=A0A7W7ABG3_9SPHN|nr:cupin domain-containing protein [Novosphingobium taihuense]MBB4613185.1 putative cupin superfamily protein [Novosphingobium taihuense]TWH85326.1 putative cupin superfamily protein [Novosphingobium taihuense]
MTTTTSNVHSFYDLRAFAADVRFGDATDADVITGWAADSCALPLSQGPVAVLAARIAPKGNHAGLEADEFVFVLEGKLTLVKGNHSVALPRNASAVIPAGKPFAWQAAVGTTVIIMRCGSGPAGAETIVPIDESMDLVPSGPPLAELLVGATPSCRNFTDYRSANGEFVCGTWDSTPYHRLSMPYRHHEFMHLLEGDVTFVDGNGREATFSRGDAFLVEMGAHCSWESRNHVKKVYAIYRPAA